MSEYARCVECNARYRPPENDPGRCKKCRTMGQGEAPFVAATRAELVEAGRDRSASGLLLLEIAASISAGGHTATGLAALQKAYAGQRAEALVDADVGGTNGQVLDAIYAQ